MRTRRLAPVLLVALAAPVLLGAAPPRGTTEEKIEVYMFRGEFEDALKLAQGDDKEKAKAATYQRFVDAGKLLADKKYGEASAAFSALEGADESLRLFAAFWVCETEKIGGEIGKALACFRSKGIDPFHVKQRIAKRTGDGTLKDGTIVNCECLAHCQWVHIAGEICQTVRWTVASPDNCMTKRLPECVK